MLSRLIAKVQNSIRLIYCFSYFKKPTEPFISIKKQERRDERKTAEERRKSLEEKPKKKKKEQKPAFSLANDKNKHAGKIPGGWTPRKGSFSHKLYKL